MPHSPIAATIPHAVLPGKISSASQQEIIALSGSRPGRFWGEVGGTWLSIFLLMALASISGSLAVQVLCTVLIGTRQLVLALLLHEQVHRLGGRSKHADWFVNIFVAYPLFVTSVEAYARVHLTHHKHFFTQKDPDFLRKAGPEWTFPMSPGRFLRIVLKDIMALNVLRLIRGKSGFQTTEFARRYPTPGWMRFALYSLIAAMLTMTGQWHTFLLYWVLPAMTISQLLIRWIAICEHQYNIEHGTVHETTPLIELKWWQRLITPDLNFGLHAYHHLHPGVSFSNLPRVHAIYKREGLVDESAIFKGQGAYLAYLIAARKSGDKLSAD